jgi:hypothetical protein
MVLLITQKLQHGTAHTMYTIMLLNVHSKMITNRIHLCVERKESNYILLISICVPKMLPAQTDIFVSVRNTIVLFKTLEDAKIGRIEQAKICTFELLASKQRKGVRYTKGKFEKDNFQRFSKEFESTENETKEFYEHLNYFLSQTPILFSLYHKGYVVVKDFRHVPFADPKLCLCETVNDNSCRPFLDFDENVENYIEDIEIQLKHFFRKIHQVGVRTSWKYSSYNGREIRWHCVVSGVALINCWKDESINMAKFIMERLPHIQIDIGVYRKNGSLRMVNQFKYSEGYHCRFLYPWKDYKYEDLSINIRPEDLQITQRSSDPKSYTKRAYDDEDLSTFEAISSFRIPPGFVLESKVTNWDTTKTIRLLRVSPSYCQFCKKMHHSENAYLIVSGDFVKLKCFRYEEFYKYCC